MNSKDHRIRQIEITLAGISQRVTDHEQDFRRFGPLVTEQALIRQKMEQIGVDLTEAHNQLRELHTHLEAEANDRRQAQLEYREGMEKTLKLREETRMAQNQELRNRIRVATLALAGVFVTSGMSVLTAILAGGGS